MNYTPGPWLTDRNHIITDKGDEIATASYRQSGYVQANIRLIAAAPELLEALKEITTFFANACQCKMSDGFVCIVHRTKKAISKAEGRVKP